MLLLRFLWTMIRARFRERLGPMDESLLRLRVWPNDIDVNLHLNNGRYLTIMDLGRMDLVARSGILGQALRRRWYPLVGSAAIRFIRSLDPFQLYELRTRILGWDEKWFYLEQRFERDGNPVAIGWIQGLFRGKDGNVPPRELLRMAGSELESPPLPDWVNQWQSAMRSAGEGR